MGNGTGGRQLRIAYVCDGGRRLGLGHVSRGRALLASGAHQMYVGAGIAEVSSLFPDLELVPWSSSATPFEPGELAADVVVVDDYSLSDEWIAAIAARVPVAIVDDWRRPESAAHLVINPNVGAAERFYPSRDPRTCLCGARYSLIRPELATLRGEHRARPGSVLVTLGGGDSPVDLEELVSAILEQAGGELRRVDVVLGPASSPDIPPAGASGDHRVALHRGPEDFVRMCAESEVVVCSASTTSHEMAYLGVAFVPVVTVKNQERIGLGWEEAGVAPYLSINDPMFPENLVSRVRGLLRDPSARETCAARGPRIVDGDGPGRVQHGLQSLVERSGRRAP